MPTRTYRYAQYSAKLKRYDLIAIDKDLIAKINEKEVGKVLMDGKTVSKKDLATIRDAFPLRVSLFESSDGRIDMRKARLRADFIENLYINSKEGCTLFLDFYNAHVIVPPGENVAVPIQLINATTPYGSMNIHIKSGKIDKLVVSTVSVETDLRNDFLSIDKIFYNHLWDCFSMEGILYPNYYESSHRWYSFSSNGKLVDLKSSDQRPFIEKLKKQCPQILHERYHRDYFAPEKDIQCLMPGIERTLIEAFYEAIDEKSLLRELPNELLDTIAYHLV